MKRFTTFLLALIAVFALSVVAVASASAAELEFTVSPNPITKATQKGVGKLETTGGRTVECSSGETKGKVSGPKETEVKSVVFKGCKSTAFGGKECQSGSTAGEIVTKELTGKLVFPKGGKGKEAAIALEPKELTGGESIFVVFKCKTLLKEETVTVRGSVVCPIEKVKTKTKKFTLTCSEEKGKQKPEEYETEAGTKVKDILETKGEGQEVFAYEQSAENATSELEVEKETEIKV